MGKFAIIIVTSLFILLAAFIVSTNTTSRFSVERNVESYRLNQARNIANSAAQIGVTNLQDGTWTVAEGQTSFFTTGPDNYQNWSDLDGSYRIRVENQGGTYIMTSTGKTGLANDTEASIYDITVSLSVQAGESDYPILDHAVFVKSSLTLTGSSEIHGNAGTNSTASNSVNFGWSTRVLGSFNVGPGGDYNDVIHSDGWGRTPEDNITGSISDLDAPRQYDLPDFPDFPVGLPNRGDFSTPWVAGLYYPITEDGHYGTITASSNRTITVDLGGGDRILRLDNFNISQGHINLINTGTDGKLILYVDNNFTLGGSATVNNSGDPKHLIMYYAGSGAINPGGNTRFNGSIHAETADITIGGSNGVLGHIITGGSNVTITGNAEAHVRALYAPNADILITGSGRVRGAVVGNSVSIEGNGRVFFDDDFADPLPGFGEPGAGAAEIIILQWF